MRSIRLIYGLILRRLLQRRRAIGLMALTSLPAVAVLLSATSLTAARSLELYHGLTAAMLLAAGFPVAALVNSAAAFGEERSRQTIGYLTVKPTPRASIATAVTLAGLTASLVVGLVGVALGWVAGVLATDQAGIGWPTTVAVTVAAIGYAAVFVPLGLGVRRATLAGLAYVFVWEGIIAGFITTLSPSSLWRTSLSAYLALAEDYDPDIVDALGVITPGVGGAFAKVLILLVVSIAASTILLRRRDLV